MLPKGRKTKLAAFGLTPSLIKAGDPEYAQCLYQANKYRKTRMKELATAHGSVSAGVGALVASASLCLAASRYLFQRAAGAPGGADPELLKLAAKLSSDGRQNDLAAWELCAREGAVKRRQAVDSQMTPWDVTDSGKLLDKPGRKTNIQRALAHEESADSEGVSTTVYTDPEVPE